MHLHYFIKFPWPGLFLLPIEDFKPLCSKTSNPKLVYFCLLEIKLKVKIHNELISNQYFFIIIYKHFYLICLSELSPFNWNHRLNAFF